MLSTSQWIGQSRRWNCKAVTIAKAILIKCRIVVAYGTKTVVRKSRLIIGNKCPSKSRMWNKAKSLSSGGLVNEL